MNSQTLASIGPELEEIVVKRFVAEDGTYHPVTLLTACAAVSGLLLLRSVNLDLSKLDPDQVIVSDEVNARGGELVTRLMSTMADIGLDTSGINPATPIPDDAKPEREIPELALELEADFTRVFDRAKVSLDDRAEYAVVVLAFFMKTTLEAITVPVAFNIALNALMIAAKTVPLRPQALQ